MSSTSTRACALSKTLDKAAETDDMATTAASSCDGLIVGVESCDKKTRNQRGMAGVVAAAGSVVQSGGRVLGGNAMSTKRNAGTEGTLANVNTFALSTTNERLVKSKKQRVQAKTEEMDGSEGEWRGAVGVGQWSTERKADRG
jgi:hypothetical protein